MKPERKPLGTQGPSRTTATAIGGAALLLLSVGLLPVAAGTHDGACFGAVTTIPLAAATLYRDQRVHPNPPFSDRQRDVLYLESNGIAGLQSGGTDLTDTVGDPCFEGDNHDQLILCRQGCKLR